MKIVKYDTYRSKPLVNMPNDRVRVTLDMTKVAWFLLLKVMDESEYFSPITKEEVVDGE